MVAWVAITIYALADWYRTDEDELPARIPKMLWLILIILTIPSFSLGAIAWLITRAVMRTEKGEPPLGFTPPTRPEQPPAPTAPDDDPEFLFRLERDIQRQRRAQMNGGGRGSSSSKPASGDSSNESPESEGTADPER